MGSRPEQIGSKKAEYRVPFVEQSSKRAGGWRQFAKRAAHRLRRREEKLDPENAPKKPRYWGWGW